MAKQVNKKSSSQHYGETVTQAMRYSNGGEISSTYINPATKTKTGRSLKKKLDNADYEVNKKWTNSPETEEGVSVRRGRAKVDVLKSAYLKANKK